MAACEAAPVSWGHVFSRPASATLRAADESRTEVLQHGLQPREPLMSRHFPAGEKSPLRNWSLARAFSLAE
jgi:hypothetical protein